MKLNVMFTIAAVFAFLIGIPALLVPTTCLRLPYRNSCALSSDNNDCGHWIGQHSQ